MLNQKSPIDIQKKEIRKQYSSLYNELIDGKIRANDHFRILQYECAIRRCRDALNNIIPYNGKYLDEITINITDDLKPELSHLIPTKK